MNKSTILLLVLFALMLTSCFTLHKPAYLVSELDMPNPQNAYRKTGTATANYFLVFGGNKKEGLMSAARADLWNGLNGAQNLQIANVVVDESKLVVLFIYVRHKVQIEGDFIPMENFRDTASLEAISRNKYGFVQGDRVTFTHVSPSDGSKTQLLGTMYYPPSDLVIIDSESGNVDQHKNSAAYVQADFSLKLLSSNEIGLAQGTKVSFDPINRRGNYFEGTVVRLEGQYDVWVEIAPNYVDNYYGENQAPINRIIYMPSYRIRKL